MQYFLIGAGQIVIVQRAAILVGDAVYCENRLVHILVLDDGGQGVVDGREVVPPAGQLPACDNRLDARVARKLDGCGDIVGDDGEGGLFGEMAGGLGTG